MSHYFQSSPDSMAVLDCICLGSAESQFLRANGNGERRPAYVIKWTISDYPTLNRAAFAKHQINPLQRLISIETTPQNWNDSHYMSYLSLSLSSTFFIQSHMPWLALTSLAPMILLNTRSWTLFVGHRHVSPEILGYYLVPLKGFVSKVSS